MANERYRHIFLRELPSVSDYTSASSFGGRLRIPDRDRIVHGRHLHERFERAWQQAKDKQAVIHAVREGVYIEFQSDPGADLVTQSLDNIRSKEMRLLNVRTEGEGTTSVTYATVYLSNRQKNYFLRKIQAYAERDKNKRLMRSIADIREAIVLGSFWQDDRELMPTGQKEWCEVWLSSDSDEVIQRFEQLLVQENIEKAHGVIKFPERTVKLILANRSELERLAVLSDDIAEYRRAKETAAFWLDMENHEQAQWVQDILQRCKIEPDSNVAVCILDTGINNGHPLLSSVLQDTDCQTADPNWGIDDHDGHGTLMAGVSAYGDLREHLSGTGLVRVSHCLESVKIVPRPPDQTKPNLWGYVTEQAVSRAEIQSPERKRILCMAVSAIDTRDRGRPSSWSGKLDQLSSGAIDNNKRLIVVCAGNITDFSIMSHYPDAQLTDSIHDPAQSWNALTVGAYTQLDQIRDKSFAGFSPVAPAGGLSPYSTTSLTWDKKWPIKPEIVMEGGNVVHDGKGFCSCADDVSLLSTFRDSSTRHFNDFSMTSAATAQAAWFAAQIQAAYPIIWPETIRALMVHSAEWTETLRRQFLPPNPSKADYARLLRICGYGVPSLPRALYSASNSLTLIAEGELQPFAKRDGGGYKTKEMHLYDLPWPKEVLQDLPDRTKVQMRVTLSYFIEPGPGEIGWGNRYRYASHGLRFDVKSPSETNDDFLRRINVAVRADDEGRPGTQSASNHWAIGSDGRDKGSIHSDIWSGTAAELAESGVIAVYPVIGWWRERAYLEQWGRKCRYSLIVSIVTPEETIDIYTPVAIKVGITVPVSVSM